MVLQCYVFDVVYKDTKEPAFIIDVLAKTKQGAVKKSHDKMIVRGKEFSTCPSRELKLIFHKVFDVENTEENKKV